MSEPPQEDSVSRFFGGLLVAVGALIFSLCGLCTSAFLVMSAISPGGSGVAAMALIGVIPTGLGFLVLRAGLSMYRGASHRAPPTDPKAPDA